MTQGASNEEAAWQELVAHFGEPAGTVDSRGPWPAREDLPGSLPADRGADPADTDPADTDPADTDPGGPPPAGSTDLIPGIVPAPPQARIVRPASGAPLPGDDGHYVPPAPPPLPRLDPATKGAWLALFGGPAYLLVAVMVGWAVPAWAAFCAVAAFVGGFTTLVIRMGDRPPHDSGPDDGAVV
jgi:hypothetical protein